MKRGENGKGWVGNRGGGRLGIHEICKTAGEGEREAWPGRVGQGKRECCKSGCAQRCAGLLIQRWKKAAAEGGGGGRSFPKTR